MPGCQKAGTALASWGAPQHRASISPEINRLCPACGRNFATTCGQHGRNSGDSLPGPRRAVHATPGRSEQPPAGPEPAPLPWPGDGLTQPGHTTRLCTLEGFEPGGKRLTAPQPWAGRPRARLGWRGACQGGGWSGLARAGAVARARAASVRPDDGTVWGRCSLPRILRSGQAFLGYGVTATVRPSPPSACPGRRVGLRAINRAGSY